MSWVPVALDTTILYGDPNYIGPFPDSVDWGKVDDWRGLGVRIDDNDNDIGQLPASVDWRKKGAVTTVKRQSKCYKCGSCWAFSAVGAVEGLHQIKTGSLVTLSIQELGDWNKHREHDGQGGFADYAFDYIVMNGIHTEDDYPYRSCGGECKKCDGEFKNDKLKGRVVRIDRCAYVPSKNEKKLQQAVAKQPVSVHICTDDDFVNYKGGIYQSSYTGTVDHVALIVGYDTSEDGLDYWIIKNSWGTNWGINGYMHMLRNSGKPQGICKINTLACYPTLRTQRRRSPLWSKVISSLTTYFGGI